MRNQVAGQKVFKGINGTPPIKVEEFLPPDVFIKIIGLFQIFIYQILHEILLD